MRTVVSFTSRLSYLFAVIAGAGTFLMMVMVGLDVTLRFSGGGFPAALELVQHYLMLMIAFLPLARIERRDAAISVDALFTILPPAAQRVITVFVALCCTVCYGVFAVFTWHDAVHQYSIGAYAFAVKLQLPIWPGYFLLPVSFGLAAIVTFIRIFEVAAGTHLPERDPTDMAALVAGPEATGAGKAGDAR